ncbi:MAG: hypothetical protein VYB61_06470 [Verrucomicrobiota bacterium]|nr:hypothetical protein [Verrucomicrobiota bacterium]
MARIALALPGDYPVPGSRSIAWLWLLVIKDHFLIENVLEASGLSPFHKGKNNGQDMCPIPGNKACITSSAQA